MTKISLYLTDAQLAWLKERAERLDLPHGYSEALRRLLDAEMAKEQRRREKLEAGK